jgi:hypothetical protein
MSEVVQKLWGFCHVLRHDGIDYIKHITYLLFIKTADERGVTLPKGCSWPNLEAESGTALTGHYADVLRTVGKQAGILGDIFAGSMPRFSNPVNLKRLITLIDETEWTSLDKDVKAEAFEGLLEKAASEGNKGAGQFFTPRPLNGRSSREPEQSKDGRWRSFHISEVKNRDFKLDSFKWIKDDSLEDADEVPEPEELATNAIAELEGAVGELNALLDLLEREEKVVS